MRTFKKIIAFLVLNVVTIVLLTIILAQPSVVKVLMKDAKSENYSTLILGESHGETSINPFLLTEKTGEEVFNFSRRLMPVINLRYILEEANALNQYKTVILDLDSSYWTLGHTGNAGTDTNLLLKLSGKRKIDYICNVLWNDNYNETFFDYNLNSDTLKRIPKTLKGKFNGDYLKCNEASVTNTYNVIGVAKSFEYVGRGFRYGVKKSGIDWPFWNFDVNEVKEENIKAFREIVDYCRDNCIELICIQSALPPYRLQKENLDDVHDYFSELCNQYSVPFYDMNYLKKGYLDRTDDDYVDKDGHMMGKLADRHTEVLANILRTADKNEFFYNNYEDVLNSLEGTK